MNRPPFKSAWIAAQRIVAPAHQSQKVAQIIGGAVAKNIKLLPPQGWTNTCAVRLSYVLNYSGVQIPRLIGMTVSGADKHWYFFRVRDVIDFLTHRWGEADMTIPFPRLPDATLQNKKGVILFEVKGWQDANGHASLWNGASCYDHCYFNDQAATYQTERARFWTLS